MELARWFNQSPFGKSANEWTYPQKRAIVLYLNKQIEKNDAMKASNSAGLNWSGNFGTVPPHLRK